MIRLWPTKPAYPLGFWWYLPPNGPVAIKCHTADTVARKAVALSKNTPEAVPILGPSKTVAAVALDGELFFRNPEGVDHMERRETGSVPIRETERWRQAPEE